MVDNEVNEALNALAEEINKSKMTEAILTLNQPVKVTVSTEKGYRKKPLAGGETFQIVSCYVGKRKGLIYKFSVVEGGQTAELSHKEALNLLDGYEDALCDTFGEDWRGVFANAAKLVAKAKRDRAKAKKENDSKVFDERAEECPLFGTW